MLRGLGTRADSCFTRCAIGSGEGAAAGEVAADEQGLDGFGAFVGVDGFDVGHVLGDTVVEQDSVAAQKISGGGGDPAGGAGVVVLGQGSLGGGQGLGGVEVGDPAAMELHRGEVGEHLGEPFLDELEPGEGFAELDALLGVGQGSLVAGGGVAEGGPGDSGAGGEQHPGGVLEGAGAGQQGVGGQVHVVQGDQCLMDGPQGRLASDDLAPVAGGVLGHQEAADGAVVVGAGVVHPGEDEGDAAGGAVADPFLGAAQDPAVLVAAGAGFQGD